MIRKFEPGSRVAARIEVSAGGWLRKQDAGVDVMGDGALVAFKGGVGRKELFRGRDLDPAIDAVRGALERPG